MLTPQDTRLAENNSEKAWTNIHQKFRFQTSFQRKYQALMESKGIDKLAQYLYEPISQDVDMNLIEYWFKMVDVDGMRDLAQMAIEILRILAMSAEPERVFSGGKITLTDR